ncbi:MAG TPA: ABC transporter ATP-binding protein [Gemmatimonadaceae bacterium]|nr:ABC transporter ATP-binding protein [Gemmatimonadaceae bacterium]
MTDPHTTPVIAIRNLQRTYRKGGAETAVLRGVTADVGRGEFLAITGASGSGKSTLMNILGLLDQPDAGTYLLDGVDVSRADDDARSTLRSRHIGFVFQQFHLMERATALENVMLPLLYATDEHTDGDARARAALETVGLAHRLTHRPGELSGGEQQRVAIARALINDPSLLLADEPTGNLDERSGAEVMELLRSLQAAGRTIVLVTHDPTLAARADRAMVMRDGRLDARELAGAE